jgi:hypothetical protein
VLLDQWNEVHAMMGIKSQGWTKTDEKKERKKERNGT